MEYQPTRPPGKEPRPTLAVRIGTSMAGKAPSPCSLLQTRTCRRGRTQLHARTCDQLDVPLALALHELHIVAGSRPVDACAPRVRALDLHLGQRLILKQAHADRSSVAHTSTVAFDRGKKRG